MVNYAYNYAEIDPEDNMCVGVYTCTYETDDPNWVEIPAYDNVFIFKYYNWDTEKWYYNSKMTEEFVYGA